MEHRHSPRQATNLKAILITHEGKQYLAEITDFSSIGLRAILKETFAENIKVVEVILFVPKTSSENIYEMEPFKMFVARRQGRVLGLCLLNEQARFPDNLGKPASVQPRHLGRIANSRS